MTETAISPPSYLSTNAKKWWRRAQREFALNTAAELSVLTEAAASLDRIAECREHIRRDGLIVIGKNGPMTHPAARLEQQHRSLHLQCVRSIGIAMPIKED